MVKLIMTDIDGTLVSDGNVNLNPEYFDVFRKLIQNGVAVAIASGRHSVSLKNMFAPIMDDIWVVSQNGCVIEYGGKTHVLRPVPLPWVREFWQDLGQTGEADSILDTAEKTFCPFDGTEMYHWVRDSYKFNITGTGGWEHVPEETISMMTIYHPVSAWDFVLRSGIYDKWKDRISLVSTGQVWVDCMMPGNDKGSGLRFLTEQLGIAQNETIAFGDNFNDIPMIEAAGIGYAVDNAAEAVQKSADRIIPGWREDGVLQVLKNVLKEYDK